MIQKIWYYERTIDCINGERIVGCFDHIGIGVLVLALLRITTLDVYIGDWSKLSNDDGLSIQLVVTQSLSAVIRDRSTISETSSVD